MNCHMHVAPRRPSQELGEKAWKIKKAWAAVRPEVRQERATHFPVEANKWPCYTFNLRSLYLWRWRRISMAHTVRGVLNCLSALRRSLQCCLSAAAVRLTTGCLLRWKGVGGSRCWFAISDYHLINKVLKTLYTLTVGETRRRGCPHVLQWNDHTTPAAQRSQFIKQTVTTSHKYVVSLIPVPQTAGHCVS